MSLYCLLACRVSDEKSVLNLMEDLLYITCHFSLAAIKILSLSFTIWL
jgi:hypothetical protein